MTDVMEDADVGMIQTRDGLGFALEALLADGVTRKMSRKNLDGYGALKAQVPTAIYFPHPACPKRSHNLIRPQFCA
jgi:hypothetical protein